MNLPAGYRARHASLDDIDLVDRLFQEVDRAMVGEAESSAVWIKEDWSSDWVDLATMTRLIFAPGGSVAAYANLEAVDPRVEVGASGRVHPEHVRSEEHTSELQSPYELVCSLLLENMNE